MGSICCKDGGLLKCSERNGKVLRVKGSESLTSFVPYELRKGELRVFLDDPQSIPLVKLTEEVEVNGRKATECAPSSKTLPRLYWIARIKGSISRISISRSGLIGLASWDGCAYLFSFKGELVEKFCIPK